MQDDGAAAVRFVQVSRQMLIEKIVNLQKSLAHKSEKLDFLEAHIAHLVDDVSRKNRLDFVAYIHKFVTRYVITFRNSGQMGIVSNGISKT